MKKIVIFMLIITLAALCSAQSMRPMVSKLSVSFSPDNNTATITWTLDEEVAKQIAELYVFKNAGNIIQASTLSILTPIATLSPQKTNYVDTLDDFRSYYYAVIARTVTGDMYDVIIPTINASDTSIARSKLQEANYAQNLASEDNDETSYIDTSIEAPLRTKPLPYLDIISNHEQAQELLLANSAMQKNDNESLFDTEILNEDKNGESATGDNYTLFLIVDTMIKHEEWESAQNELIKFLQTNRSDSATARANFYIAQSYYFEGNYRLALTHFQRAEKLYPINSKKWIQESLNRFTLS